MPSPRAFLDAFGLKKNVNLGDHTRIVSVAIQHIVVERYRKYTFPMTVDVITSHASIRSVQDEFETYVAGHQTVNSQYGNPYDCYISDVAVTKAGKGLDQFLTRTCYSE